MSRNNRLDPNPVIASEAKQPRGAALTLGCFASLAMTALKRLFLNDALLKEAATMRGAGLAEAAGRSAYLAGFHAAQATIFERTTRVLKTHNGVHREFSRLMKEDRDLPAGLLGFLPQSYEIKAIADYGVGPSAHVTLEEADAAIAAAARLIADVEAELATS